MLQTMHAFGGHTTAANSRVDERYRPSRSSLCILSISTRWISSIFADFGLTFLCATLRILRVSGCWARNKIRSIEVNMRRERLKQIVLIIVGLMNLAQIYFLYTDLRHSRWLLEGKSEIHPMFL